MQVLKYLTSPEKIMQFKCWCKSLIAHSSVWWESYKCPWGVWNAGSLLIGSAKKSRSGFDFTSVFALTKFLPSSRWDYLRHGWGEISRLCGISCWFFQLSGILQFWSQEVSGFLTTYSKVSVCFILLRRRFKERRLIKNDDVCAFCFWLSFSQTFQENFFCLCYVLNFLRSVLPRDHNITWELLIGRCFTTFCCSKPTRTCL